MSGQRWETFRHPTGGEMQVPPGWQVTTSPLGLQLVPPDMAFTAQGAAEIYTLTVHPAPGIARADDPRVLLHVDGALRKVLPTLGAPSPPTACGPGVALKWSTRDPQSGGDLLALALLQIADAAITGILAIGEKPRIEARDAVLQQIFCSFKQGEKQRDPALVGTWHHQAATRTTMLLAIDGTAIEKTHTVRTGTWTGGAGMAYVTWSDGTSTVGPYQITGTPRRMILAGLEWTEHSG